MSIKETHIELRNSKAKEVLKKIMANKEADFEKNRTPEAIEEIKKLLPIKKK